MANVPAPTAGGAGDISAEMIQMASESKGSIESATESQHETPNSGPGDVSAYKLEMDSSVSFLKLPDTSEQDIEDDESIVSSSRSSSGSESDSDTVEISSIKSGRPVSAKRPAHVRSVWAVPLRIRTKDTAKREMFDAALFNLVSMLKDRQLNKEKQDYAKNHLDTLRIGTIIVNQVIGHRMLSRDVLVQQQRMHTLRNVTKFDIEEIQLLEASSKPTDWTTSEYYNNVTRKSRVSTLVPKETIMLGSSPNGQNIGGKNDKEYEGPAYFIVLSGEVMVKRVLHGDPRRQHHHNYHHNHHHDKPIRCWDMTFRAGEQFYTLDTLPYLINGEAIHHVSPEDGSTLPLLYIKAVTRSKVLRVPLQVLRAPKQRSKTLQSKMQLLRGHSAFDKMADDVVKSFARKLTKVVVRRGGEIFKQGGKAKAMYVVEEGTCYMTYNKNAEVSIAHKKAQAAKSLAPRHRKTDKSLKVNKIDRQQNNTRKSNNAVTSKKTTRKPEKKGAPQSKPQEKKADLELTEPVVEYSTEPKRDNYHKSTLGKKRDLLVTRINRGQWIGDVGLLLREEHMVTVVVTTQACTLWMFKPPLGFFQRGGVYSLFEGSKGEDITDLFDRLRLLAQQKRHYRIRRIHQLEMHGKNVEERKERDLRRMIKKSSSSGGAPEPIASSLSEDTMAGTSGANGVQGCLDRTCRILLHSHGMPVPNNAKRGVAN